MIRAPHLALLSVVLLALPALAQDAPPEHGRIAAEVRSVLARRDLARSRIGVAVWSVEHDRVVVAVGADRPLAPASTAKLVTVHTALELLGPGFEWQTALFLKGRPADRSTLEGDLVVVGDGDPNLSGRFHDGDTLFLFRRWAGILAEKGIRTITGDLVVDSTAFDRVFVHRSWDEKDAGRWYGAPVSALSLNDNCVDVHFSPGAGPGRPARVELVPDVGHFELEGSLGTTAARAEHRIVAWRRPASNRIVVGGNVWTGAGRETAWIPVDEPDVLFGRALARVLAEAGVEVRGTVRVADRPVDVSSAFRVDVHRTGMGPTLAVLAKRSQNFYAEQVFKRCGLAARGVGTWETGREAVAGVLARAGVEPGTYVADDGSGLSRKNEYTADSVLRVLVAAWRSPHREVFYGCLPISGTDGTLEDRMKEPHLAGRVRAKTGTMSGVSGLAGSVEGAGGRYLFVFLGEGEVGALRRAQDDVCGILAGGR